MLELYDETNTGADPGIGVRGGGGCRAKHRAVTPYTQIRTCVHIIFKLFENFFYLYYSIKNSTD